MSVVGEAEEGEAAAAAGEEEAVREAINDDVASTHTVT